MPLKLNIGLSKKVGLPDYGSLGASCHVEVELDGSLLQQDPEAFHRHVRNAYVACSQAVNDELARHLEHSGNASNGNRNGSRVENANGGSGTQGNGHSDTNYSNGNGRNGSSRGAGRAATASQARAIRAIAGRQRIELGDLLAGRYGVSRPEDLSISEASNLIDELKAPANGDGRRS
jgi:hypothetical protein